MEVAIATAIGCRVSTTNRASGNIACRNRVRIALGGDFSTSTGRDRSQCGFHSASSRCRFCIGGQRRVLGHVRAARECEPAGAAQPVAGRVHALQVLPLVLGHAGAAEPADGRVGLQAAGEQRRPAAVQPPDEDVGVLGHRGMLSRAQKAVR